MNEVGWWARVGGWEGAGALGTLMAGEHPGTAALHTGAHWGLNLWLCLPGLGCIQMPFKENRVTKSPL